MFRAFPIASVAFILSVFITTLDAQSPDSARVFTQEELFEWLLLYHPVARQANLLDDEARANLRMARGHFDPKLYSEWEQKSFDGSEYFTFGNSGLKVPTWYGLEFKAAFNTATGIQVDPEHKLPAVGQAVIGIQATLGRGMMIDERRAALQQARIFEQSNDAQRRLIINDLLMDAVKAYWEWTATYHQREAIRQALELARVRQQGIVEGYRQGDKPSIDTLEAFILVQTRQADLNDANVHYVNAGLQLSNFLWWENDIPVELTDSLRPAPLDETVGSAVMPSVEGLAQQALERHPILAFYLLKINSLEVDRRLAAEQLKPQLDVEYNLLGNGLNLLYDANGGGSTFNDLFLQNYKWGLQFNMPIFLRKERAKLELTRLKIQDAGLELQQKRLEIANKVRAYFNDWQNTQQQILLYQNMEVNYRILLDAEVTRFQLGESSIFLINAREQKLVEVQLKLLKLLAEFQKQRMYTEWAAGRLE
ncbi:MAG: TolC family protein [Saprospiraceae bacterium]|nr:TolC family protein [Saprospiraceae bacterium]